MLDQLIIAQAAASGQDTLLQMAPLLLIFVVFYFFLIRPQQKKIKMHREMVSALKKGDAVITAGGLKGKIVKVSDDEVLVELAENVRVRAVRDTVSAVVAKPEPAKAESKTEAKAESANEAEKA